MRSVLRALLRLLTLAVLSAIALQFYFLARIALMVVIDPQSTTFQRSEAWRLLVEKQQIMWSQQWVDYERISPNLKRAVIASEDAEFAEHSGVDWDAIEKAWERNQRASSAARRRRRARSRWSAARPSPSSWPRTSSSAANAAWRARARSSSSR